MTEAVKTTPTPSQFTIKKTGLSKEFPAKVVLYGVPKIGKSRFCSNAEKPFFIDVEGGLSYVGKEIATTGTLKSLAEVIDWLQHLLKPSTDTSDIKTIVVDSIDWIEKLAQDKLVKAYNAANITDPRVKDFGYSNGREMASSESWRVVALLDEIYKTKGIKAILISHSNIKNVELPGKENYSKHMLKLYKSLASKINEWADLILFADYDFHVVDGKTSEPKPMLFAGGDASFEGGGRMLLKKKIPLDFAALEKELKGA